jgi:hypothetical protein
VLCPCHSRCGPCHTSSLIRAVSGTALHLKLWSLPVLNSKSLPPCLLGLKGQSRCRAAILEQTGTSAWRCTGQETTPTQGPSTDGSTQEVWGRWDSAMSELQVVTSSSQLACFGLSPSLFLWPAHL